MLKEDFPDVYTTYSTYLYQDRVDSILDNYAADSGANPLFLYFPIQSPHDPIEAPQEYQDLYVDKFPGSTINDKRLTVSGLVMRNMFYVTGKNARRTLFRYLLDII